jgi:hypothetical protein
VEAMVLNAQLVPEIRLNRTPFRLRRGNLHTLISKLEKFNHLERFLKWVRFFPNFWCQILKYDLNFNFIQNVVEYEINTSS